MALTVPVETDRVISLEEYLDFVRARLGAGDPDQVCDSAPQLAQLANNRTFLTKKLTEELSNWRTFQSRNAFTAQSFLLGSVEGLYLRANIWMPLPELRLPTDRGNYLFSYQIPHDHNFSFLTIGYWGPGYETTIFEYDRRRVAGLAGEHVDLRFLERTTLPEKKVMFYRALRDVHSQEPPSEFSISLNLVLPLPAHEQLFFDFTSSTITGHAPPAGSGGILLCRLAKHLGDAHSANALEAIAGRHPCRRTRAAAYDSWAALASGSEAQIWQKALADSAEVVRRLGRSRLDQLA
jgi:hypothetical protein